MSVCDNCKKTFSRRDVLLRHKLNSCPVWKSKDGAVFKVSCFQKAGDKRPSCKKISESIDGEFQPSAVKSVKPLEMINKLVNNSQVSASFNENLENINNYCLSSEGDDHGDDAEIDTSQILEEDDSDHDTEIDTSPILEKNDEFNVEHMINLTSKDLILPRCKRIKQLIEDLKKQLENLSEYGENLKQIESISQEFCKGNHFVVEELRQAIRSVENSPAKKVTLAELAMLINEIDFQLHRVREIFTRLNKVEKEDIPELLIRLENEHLIDANIREKLASLTSITNPEVRTLLVKSEPGAVEAIEEFSLEDDDVIPEKENDILSIDDPRSDGKMYLRKGNCCCRVKTTQGGGLHLSPYGSDGPYISPYRGDGLFLQHNGKIYNGKGILLGPNSPFKSIPILGLLL